MSRSDNRNVVLLAALGTQPSSLVGLLNTHPEIAAPPAMRLTALLHVASRNVVRSVRRNNVLPDATLTDTVAYARESCTAALSAVFDEVRQLARSRIIVLSDPDRLAFPLSDVSGIDVILLRPGPALLGFEHLSDVYEQHVAALVRQDVDGLLSRTRIWGVGDDSIFSIDEDTVYSEPGFGDLLTFLGADTCSASVILSDRLSIRAAGAD